MAKLKEIIKSTRGGDMANTIIYVRDSITGVRLALKAIDNNDGTYTW